ncbi:hypothetical protein ACFQZ4_30950 [Catellatospora coxensis]
MHNSPAGTGDWFGWANAVISELIPIAAMLVMRRRHAAGQPIGYPIFLLVAALGFSVAAQIAVAKPGATGYLVSVFPALAFAALAKLILGKGPAAEVAADPAPAAVRDDRPRPVPVPDVRPRPQDVPAPSPTPLRVPNERPRYVPAVPETPRPSRWPRTVLSRSPPSRLSWCGRSRRSSPTCPPWSARSRNGPPRRCRQTCSTAPAPPSPSTSRPTDGRSPATSCGRCCGSATTPPARSCAPSV